MGRFTKKGDRKRLTRKRVTIGNTRTQVYEPTIVPEPTRFFPSEEQSFANYMRDYSIISSSRRPKGVYPVEKRSLVAKHAPLRLTLRHRLGRLQRKLKGIPESNTVDISAMMSRSRSRPNHNHNHAIPLSGIGEE